MNLICSFWDLKLWEMMICQAFPRRLRMYELAIFGLKKKTYCTTRWLYAPISSSGLIRTEKFCRFRHWFDIIIRYLQAYWIYRYISLTNTGLSEMAKNNMQKLPIYCSCKCLFMKKIIKPVEQPILNWSQKQATISLQLKKRISISSRISAPHGQLDIRCLSGYIADKNHESCGVLLFFVSFMRMPKGCNYWLSCTPGRGNWTPACLHAPWFEVTSEHQPDSPRPFNSG